MTAGRVKDTLLTLAGVMGILSILWFAAAAVFGLSIVIVLTGSMAPGLPAGSAILVRDDVPAADLKVGDIVTVPQVGQPLPVTHRIIGIDVVPGDSAARSITLQGDDNDTPDRQPYLVETVQRAIVGCPTLGFVIRVLQTPLMIGGATLAVAGLVVWAFWPQRTAGSTNPARPRHRAGPDTAGPSDPAGTRRS